jgi:hypothetical protein
MGAGIEATMVIARALKVSTGCPDADQSIIPVSVCVNFPASIRACCAWDALYRDIKAMCLKLTKTTVHLWDDGPRPGLCIVV